MSRKKLFLLTRNPLKVAEYQQFLGPYNLVVQAIDDFESFKDPKELLTRYTTLAAANNSWAVAVDQTAVFEEATGKRLTKIGEAEDGKLVYSQTHLYYLMDQDVQLFSSQKHQGVIDYNAKEEGQEVYGWDAVFVLRPLGISYQALKKRGMKNHGRQEVLSAFAKTYLYFEEANNLQFNPFQQEGVIEFSYEAFQLVHEHPLLNAPLVKKARLDRLFKYALGNGGFFRAAKNRRQKNYWTPGLNAGIPLVAKKDAIHEITFLVHDLCHFVLPDLIYSGEQETLHHKVYIIHRMLSEAISLVLADMLFVETLEQAGIDYDFGKRKIYPLYQAIKRHKKEVTLTELLAANVEYCLLGEDHLYQALIAPEDRHHLVAFQEKYARFFKEDYKWTRQNILGMQQNAPYFSAWYQANLSTFQEQGLISIANFTQEHLQLSPTSNLPYKKLVQLVSKVVVQHYQDVLEATEQLEAPQKRSNSFKKYLLGQSLLLYKMDFYPYSNFLAQKFQKALATQQFDRALITTYRQLYHDYLQLLESVHLLHQDDVETYKEVYPIFDSFYVFYDNKKATERTLQDVAKSILDQ